MNTNEQSLVEYYVDGNSLKACEREFGISTYKIKKLLHSSNIKIRNRSEQLIIENIRRTKGVNHNYFNTLDIENSYLLGFLAGDGYIHPTRNLIKIGLSAIDEDFIYTIKEKLNIEREPTAYQTNKGFDVIELSFSSVVIKQELARYSIINNKTKKGITMSAIPPMFKWHFIRGFFDADGCYDYHNTYRIRISSLLPGILNEIQHFTTVGKVSKENKRNIYTYAVHGLPCKQFIQQMYNEATWFLPRKHKKVIQTINLHETGALHTEGE